MKDSENSKEKIKNSVITIIEKKDSVNEDFIPLLELKISVNREAVQDCMVLGFDVGRIISEKILTSLN